MFFEELLFNILTLLIVAPFHTAFFFAKGLVTLIQAGIELGVLLVSTSQTPSKSPPRFDGYRPSRYRATPCVNWPPKRLHQSPKTTDYLAPIPFDVQLARYQHSAHLYNCFTASFFGTGPYKHGITTTDNVAATTVNFTYTLTDLAPAGPDYIGMTRQLRAIGQMLAAALKTIDGAMSDPNTLTQYCTELNVQLLKPALDEIKAVTSSLPVAGLPSLGVFKAALDWPITELKKLHDTIEDEEIENPNDVPDEILQLQVTIEAVFKQLGVDLL